MKNSIVRSWMKNFKSRMSLFVLFYILAVLIFQYPSVLGATAPSVTTNPASGVEETNVTLKGSLTDDGSEDCSVWFEYGTDIGYGDKTSNQTLNTGSGHVEYMNYTDGTAEYNVNSDTWRGQTFTTTTECNITNIVFEMRKIGNPGEFTVEFFNVDVNEDPTGAPLGHKDINGSNLTTDPEWYNISLNHTVHLSASTMYSFVVDAQDGDASNRVYFGVDATNPYAGGNVKLSSDGGSSWTDSTADMDFVLINNNTGSSVGYSMNIGNDETFENLTDPGSGNEIINQSRIAAQTFTIGSNSRNDSFTLSDIEIYITSGMNIKNLSLGIQNLDGNGLPDGTDISSGSINLFGLSYFYEWVNVNMSSVTLSAGGSYALVARHYEGSSASYSFVWYESDSSYDGGMKLFSHSNGSSWTTYNSDDYVFKIISNTSGDFSPGTMYHYRGVANNSNSTVYGSDIGFLTKPNSPSGLSVQANSSDANYLTWTMGTGGNYTVIERNTISSWSRGSGTVIYNGTGVFCEDNDLSPDTVYYYQAWHYVKWYSRSITYQQYSDLNSSDSASTYGLPTITLLSPANNSEQDYSLTNMSITITGDGIFNYSIETCPGIGFAYSNSSSNGTKYCTISMSGLNHGTRYYWYVNCSQGTNWVNRSYNFWGNITYVNPPSNGDFTYNTGTNNLTLNWTKASRTHSCVVVRNNNSFPSSVYNGDIVQNTSDNEYNITITNYSYFTVFSFNSTASIFSTGLDIPWAFVGVNVFNESNPSQSIGFDIEVKNQDGTIVYYNTSCSNTLLISFEDIPYGENTIFVISNSSYQSRIYYMDIYLNNYYNFSWFLPPLVANDTTTNLYSLHVLNELDYPLEDVSILIQRYINTSDSYQNVTSLLTGANGDVEVYLIPNALYQIVLSKSGYDTKYEEYIPDPTFYGLNYPKYFRMYLSEGDVQEYSIFNQIVSFTATISNNGDIYISYSDSSELTIDTQVIIIEYYNNTEVKLNYSCNNSNSFSYTIHNANTSRSHIVRLYFNHSLSFDVVEPVIRYIMPVNLSGGSSQLTAQTLEEYFTFALGENTLGWANTLSIILALIILSSFGPFHTGIAIIGAGAGIFATQLVFVFNNPVLISIIPIVIGIGVFYIIVKKPEVKV